MGTANPRGRVHASATDPTHSGSAANPGPAAPDPPGDEEALRAEDHLAAQVLRHLRCKGTSTPWQIYLKVILSDRHYELDALVSAVQRLVAVGLLNQWDLEQRRSLPGDPAQIGLASYVEISAAGKTIVAGSSNVKETLSALTSLRTKGRATPG